MIRNPLVTLVVLAATVAQAYSNESQHTLKHCLNPAPRYKRIEDFTVKWFQDNIRREVLHSNPYKWRDPEAPFYNALFYTRGMSETAKAYACKERLITIWEPWEPELYNNSTDEKNLYSCIHHDNATRNIFFERMSEAFATKASGYVHVMHDPADYDEPPMNGIWGRIEQKALRNRVYVVNISRISGIDKNSIQIIWDRLKGWLVEYLPSQLSDQPELRRKRSENTQESVNSDDLTKSPCRARAVLPINTLPVDW